MRKRGVLGAIAAVGLVLLFPGIAAAHAGLASSDPAGGAVLEAPPAAVTLTFTEPIDPALSTVTLLGPGGASLDAPAATATSPEVLEVAVPAGVEDDVITVSWRVVSLVDGHVTAGAFAFGIGTAPTAVAPGGGEQTTSGPTPLSVTAKALLYVGLMLVLACAVVGLGLFRGRPARLHVVALSGAIAAFGGASLLLLAEQRNVGVPMQELLRSSTGRPYLWLLAVTALMAATAVIASARPAWRPALWGGGVASAVAMAIRASSGHAAAVSPLHEVVQWLHLVAVGLWAGGLVLLLLLLRERSEPTGPEPRRFSRLALGAVAVLAVTGIVRSIEQVGGVGGGLDTLSSPYGRTLAIKVALAIGVITLGARSRFRALPLLGEDARPLRRTVGTEILSLAGVLLLTATLTGISPPAGTDAGPGPAPTSAGIVAEGSDFATTMRVRVEATPGTPGVNAIQAEVLDYDTGAPLTADEIELRFRAVGRAGQPSTTLSMEPDGDMWLGQGADLSLAGTWQVTVQVRRGSDVTEIPIVLVTRSAGTADGAPGAPFATTTFPTGVSIQLALGPVTDGEGQVHVSAFAPGGDPLTLGDVLVVATPADGDPRLLEITPVDTGHVVAEGSLEPGTWALDAVLTTPDGRVFQATLTGVAIEA